MSSGRLETRIRGFQLDKLIDTALRDVEEALAERNLDVHWEAGPELGQRIYSDPARLRQVIDNLLTNAIKYTERGGISITRRTAAAARRAARRDRRHRRRHRPGRDAAPVRAVLPRRRSTAGMAEGSGLGPGGGAQPRRPDGRHDPLRLARGPGHGGRSSRCRSPKAPTGWWSTRRRASTRACRCWWSTTRATRAAPSPT